MQALLFVLPALIMFGIFVLAPLFSSLYYSFTHWDGLSSPEWVGWHNYKRAFNDDIHLSSYVHVSIYILGTLVVEVFFGLVMAVLLNSDRIGFKLMRTLFFTPVILSMVSAGLLWKFALDYNYGLLNAILKSIGLGSFVQPWLSLPETALLCVTIISGWKYAGFFMIIFFTAIRRIPNSIYEAAIIDGCGPLSSFMHITIPMLRENIVICILIAVTGGFAGFDLFYTMTNGGPYNSTEIPTTWIIKMAFDRNQMGYSIALTVIMTLVVGAVSIIYLNVTKRKDVIDY